MLLDTDTYCIVSLRAGRKDIPNEVFNTKLQKGKNESLCEKETSSKWYIIPVCEKPSALHAQRPLDCVEKH